MVYLAKLEKKIPPTAGIQEGLGKLAKRREFTEILQREMEARKLFDWRVMAFFGDLYRDTSYCINGNDGATIIVKETKFTDSHRVALVCLLKLQSSWPCPLPWKEVLHKKGGK